MALKFPTMQVRRILIIHTHNMALKGPKSEMKALVFLNSMMYRENSFLVWVLSHSFNQALQLAYMMLHIISLQNIKPKIPAQLTIYFLIDNC
jgi:hypothetical protein